MSTLTESEAEQRYDKWLNQMNINDFSLPMTTAGILKEVDPTQYDCGFADFCDAENIEIK